MTERIGTSRTPTLVEVVSTAMEKRLADVHVALPGVVQKFDPARQTVDVLPLIKESVVLDDGTVQTETLPVLVSVPVLFPRAGGYFISLPVVPGDTVLLIFNERSIDKYFFSGGKIPVDPVDLRKHDLSDAVALVGFVPVTKPLTEELSSGAVFGKEKGAQLRATGSAIEVTTKGSPAALDFVAMATKVDTILTTIHGIFAGWTPVYEAALKTAWMTAFPTGPAPTASSNLKAD